MSIVRNRELSQFGSFIYIDNDSQEIGIATETSPYVGIGTTNPSVKLHIVGDTNIEGNLNVLNGNIDAPSYTLNGNALVDVTISPWNFGPNSEIYRINGNIGIGFSNVSEKVTVNGNVSAAQFISTVTSGTPPLLVLSNTQVANLNASFLAGKTSPSGDIVGTTDIQTLDNKTLTSPTIISPNIPSGDLSINGNINVTNGSLKLYGSTSGVTTLTASSVAGGLLTLPTSTDTLVGRNTTDIFTNKTISTNFNTITGLTNSNLSGSAGITTSNLAQYTISGVPLGSNLGDLVFGSYLINFGSYNGSTTRTVSVAATSTNFANFVVARDSNGDFTAGTVNSSYSNVTFGYRVNGTTVIDSSRNLFAANGNFSGIVTCTQSNATSLYRLNGTTVIDSSRNLFAVNGSFSGIVTCIDLNSTSDISLKDSIVTVSNALDTVNSLRGVTFNWKETQKPSIGVIAQELEEVLPQLVSNGEIKSVNYNGLIGVLIEAVKELSNEVEELRKKIS